MKKIILNSMLILASVLITIALLEIAVRFLLPSPFDGSSNPADSCSTMTGWRGKPNYQTTVATEGYTHDLALNSEGMHDTEHAKVKPDDKFRILLIGDSFVQAVQVVEADTSHQQLENWLNQQAGADRFEVISGAVGGWGTGQQLLYYRSDGRTYQPDLVLLMFYMGNDVKDNLPGRGVTVEGYNCYTSYFVRPGNQLDTAPWFFAPGITPTTSQTGATWKLLNNILGRLYQSSRLYAQLEPLLSTPQLKASLLDFYLGQNEIFAYGFDLTIALVNQFEREVEADGAQFGLVLIPPLSLLDFSQSTSAEREQIYQEIPGMRRAEEIAPPNEMLNERFDSLGLTVLDLFPAFAEVDPTGKSLYFEGDKHWNQAGNQLAGETIGQWLWQTGMAEESD
ncbi:SGNH/GDSL hydrolase family protein [Anaerolineales bacterium HSG25]|nr:SGNH/GDSL hydrolase family protein [Anaerolineales bacterium HSG25]